MKKRIGIIMVCMLALVFCFAGCGSSSESKNSDKNSEKSDDKGKLDFMMGSIKSINADKNQVVINVMDMQQPDGEAPSGEKPDGEAPSGDEDGNPPAKPDGADNSDSASTDKSSAKSDSDSDKQDPPEMPEGSDGEMKEPPEGGGEQPETEEKTYTLSDSVVIQDEDGNTIGLEDLEEGQFIRFTLDGEKISSISIETMKQGEGAGQKPDGDTDSKEDSTSDDSSSKTDSSSDSEA